MKKYYGILWMISLVVLVAFQSCNSIDDDRIPNMPVNIALADPGVWNTYGVSGFGSHRDFILSKEPAGFPWKSNSATGFGGVLLIEGVDPYSAVTAAPLAFDLSCPVERSPNVRVHVENETYMAVCPQCNSVYNVTTAGGSPISGEAAEGKYKYRLRMYKVIPSGTGGYYITN